MSGHVMEVVDPYDGGWTVCRGCRAQGTFTESPAGECPSPYKSDRQLLAESLERETALRAEVERLRNSLERINLRAETFVADGIGMGAESVEAIAGITRKALEAGT